MNAPAETRGDSPRHAASQRIAVVGSGISGLAAAYLLSRRHSVVLFEAGDRLGGHSNTVDAPCDGHPVPVDTGFIVFNDRNYPNLVALFAELGVATDKSDMSFSVSVGGGALEWAGNNLATIFAQPLNLLRPSFHRMLRDILRFNGRAPADLAAGKLQGLSLGQYLERDGYSTEFHTDYLLPMGAAIWSAPMSEMLAFPARSFVRFFLNHGLLTINDRPQWRTVRGGSREYVRRIAGQLEGCIRLSTPVAALTRLADGVMVRDAQGNAELFDQVVLATHGDQALGLLADATQEERRLLGAFTFQNNLAVLHRDRAQMPKRRRVWASWNYLSDQRRDMARRVGLTYWMNQLQNLDPRHPLFVTMNPLVPPDPALTIASFDYRHPLFDEAAVRAQGELDGVQGRQRTWFCGAWTGYGFHEDGLKSAIRVAKALGAPPSWTCDLPPAGDRPPVQMLGDTALLGAVPMRSDAPALGNAQGGPP